MTTHSGSCHCGAVAFEFDGDVSSAMQCNCSICRRKGYLLAFGPIDALRVSKGADALTTYTFNKHVIQHKFCTACGCAPFGQGVGPDGAEMAAVNVRCLPDLDLATVTIQKFDGASM